MSDAGGGNGGLDAPFGKGSYEIACLSARLAKRAVDDVLMGRYRNAYVLSRPMVVSLSSTKVAMQQATCPSVGSPSSKP